MFLGIETNTGHIYEGISAPQFVVWPRPAISFAKLIQSPEDWHALPTALSHSAFEWVFREDSFDPVTRIRRGRLYQAYQNMQPQHWSVSAHPLDHDVAREIAASGRLKKALYTYWPCQTLGTDAVSGLGATLVVGSGTAASAWRVLQIEKLVDDDVLVTLKAMSAFAILPDIDESKVPEDDRQPVRRAIERVLDSAFRESAISVIDHCRNAMQVVLSRWLAQSGASAGVLRQDLDGVCKTLTQHVPTRIAMRDAANIVRLLHTRGKANRQETDGLRLATEEDAELSLQALGFTLRELGWAR